MAGLRRGEIFALDFADIDWQNDVIHVRRNLFWRYGKHHKIPAGKPKYIFYTPKTKNSVRDVDMSPKLKDALWTRYMEMQMEGKTGLIFQSKVVGSIRPQDGAYAVTIRGCGTKTFASEEEAQSYFNKERTPYDPGNFEEHYFKPAVDRILEKADKQEDEETHAAFDGLTLHHLRHTFGSWKIAQGEDVVYVSKQMGHSKPSSPTTFMPTSLRSAVLLRLSSPTKTFSVNRRLHARSNPLTGLLLYSPVFFILGYRSPLRLRGYSAK